MGWGRIDLKQDRQIFYADRTFVITPELGLELNIFTFFKLGVSGGYRWSHGVDTLPDT